jgi:hypothetical protein
MNGRSSVYVLNVLRRIVRCEVDDIPLRLQGSDRRSGGQCAVWCTCRPLKA